MQICDILIFLILLLAPSVKGVYAEQEMFLFQAAVFIAFALFLAKNRPLRPNRPLDIAAMALTLAYLVSLPGAADFREGLLGLMRVLAYLMLYLMIAARAGDEQFRRRLPVAVYLSGCLAAFVTLLNITGIVSTAWVWDGSIIHTTFEYKNTGALFMLICILTGVHLWDSYRSAGTTLLVGAGNFLLGVMMIGAQSRIVWLIAPAACAFLIAGLPAGRRLAALVKLLLCLVPAILLSGKILTLFTQEEWGPAMLLILLGALAAAALLFGCLSLEKRGPIRQRTMIAFISVLLIGIITAGIFTGSSMLAEKLRSISLSDVNFQERLAFYRDAWKLFRQNPWFGAGGRAWDILYLNIQSYGYYAENTHNDFLQIALETGLLGLAAFVSVWAAFFAAALKVIPRAGAAGQKAAGRLSLSIGLAVFVHILLDFDLAAGAMSFVLWSLFGLVRSMEPPVPQAPAYRRPLYKSPLFIGVLGAGTVYTLVSLSLFAGDMYFAKGEKALDSGDLLATRDYFMKAAVLDPRKTNTLVSLAQVNLGLYRNGHQDSLQQALYYAEKAISARPNEPLSRSVYSGALLYQGDFARSVSEAESYVQLNPMLQKAYEELGSRYITAGLSLSGQGNRREARQYFEKALRIPEMIRVRMQTVSQRDLSLWKANSAEPILTVTPIINVYCGAANLFLGNAAKGRELILSSLESQPGSPEIIVWSAVAEDFAGDKNKARALLAGISQQNPGVTESFESIRNSLGSN